ncbi:hypothetical protein GGI07_003551 [Coemansia sp. Benny D115]|nr:hypothetical protein GGI07_003551 [Coemansia sp. Benny D115]
MSTPKDTSTAAGEAQPEYITVSWPVRMINHAFSGITEAPRIAVRMEKKTMSVEYEPTKLWIKRTATAALFAVAAGAALYRRKRLQDVNGLVSLAGASRPILSGVTWSMGIAGALNARPVRPAE